MVATLGLGIVGASRKAQSQHSCQEVQSGTKIRPRQELEQAGYELLHEAREEPWGETVARLQSPEGAIIGISYAPVLHD
jgi:hypothetical protein